MTDPELPVAPERRRLWIALGVTLVAVPILVIDNLPDDDSPAATTTTVGVISPATPPRDRPETGPRKGISVVTSSTTSSTTPLTTTTTVVG